MTVLLSISIFDHILSLDVKMLFTSLSSCFLLTLANFALADSGLHVLGGSYEPPEVQALAQSVIDQFGK